MAKRPAARKSAPMAPRKATPSRASTRKPVAKKTASRPAAKRRAARPKQAARTGPLFAPLVGAELRYVGHVQLEVVRAGAARVKRMIYPPGFHWAADMKPVTGTDLCMHAHVGFLAHGEIHIEYADGCIVEFKAPQVVAIDPGHDGWVVGTEPVVLIELDFERETAAKLGMPSAHRH